MVAYKRRKFMLKLFSSEVGVFVFNLKRFLGVNSFEFIQQFQPTFVLKAAQKFHS